MNATEKLKDEELLFLMKTGDEEAFITLYRRRHGPVFKFALQMCGVREIAEDVTQEVFLTLMREPQRFDPCKGSLASFLYGIARNYVLQRLGRERLFVSITDDAEDEENSFVDARFIDATSVLDNLTRDETIKILQSAILALPPHYREVIVLCDLNELSYAEAASVVNCAVGTIRSRLHRARALLVLKLQADKRCVETTKDEGEEAFLLKVFNVARCFI